MGGGSLSRVQGLPVTDPEVLSRFERVLDLDTAVNTAVAIRFVSAGDYDFTVDHMALYLPWP